jgi:hypothetical protein
VKLSQGNSLCRFHYLKQAKMPPFSVYLLSFFFYNIGEEEGGTVPAWSWGG